MKKPKLTALNTRTDVTPRRADTTNTGAMPRLNTGRSSQFASLPPRLDSDTATFSKPTTQAQPQFGLNKWWLTAAFPFLLAGCSKDSQTPMNPGTPCPDGVTPPCNIENPAIPFTDGQPYQTFDDVSDQFSIRFVEGGLLSGGNKHPYERGDFQDSTLVSDIQRDLAAGNYNGPSKIDLLQDEHFTQVTCGNDPRVARIVLGSYGDNELSNSYKDFLIENAKFRFEGDPDIENILGFKPEYEPNFTMKNFRDQNLVIFSDKLDGSSGQTAGPVLNNEAVDLLDTDGSSPVEQLNLDAVTAVEHILNWDNLAVRADHSKFGLEVNDDIGRATLSGVLSSPMGEELLSQDLSNGEGRYVLAPGAKIARGLGFVASPNNFLEEGYHANYPQVDSLSRDPASAPEITYYETVTNKKLPDNKFTLNTFRDALESANDEMNDSEGFAEDAKRRYGPLVPAEDNN